MSDEESVASKAELVVRVLELAGTGHSFPRENELGSEQLRLSDEVKARYQRYKSLPGYDFTKAAWQARVEVTQEILESHADPKDALIAKMAEALRDCLPQITDIPEGDAWCHQCCRSAATANEIKHKASCDYVTISSLLSSDAAQKALAEREELLRDKRRLEWWISRYGGR
jgi:hypothetical protein